MAKNNINIEDARIGFKNFSGKEGKFNPPGRRNFCVFIDTELASKLQEDGWNVRWLEPKDPQDDIAPYLQVAVNYDNIPPKIVLMTQYGDAVKGKTMLDVDSVSLLDWAEIVKVDLIIRPYNWVINEGTRNEKSGTKAYVKAMYVTIVGDEFEEKYFNVPTEVNTEEFDGD